MPYTFLPDAVAFLSVVTEKDKSPTKIQILVYFNFSLISEKKNKFKYKSNKINHCHSDSVFQIFIWICVISLGPFFPSLWYSLIHTIMENFKNYFFYYKFLENKNIHLPLRSSVMELCKKGWYQRHICRFWYVSNVDKKLNSDFSSDFTCSPFDWILTYLGFSLIDDNCLYFLWISKSLKLSQEW